MKTALRFFVVFILLSFFVYKNNIIGSVYSQNTNNTSVSAQNEKTTNLNPYTVPDTNPDVPQNLHTLTQGIIISMLSSATCIITGYDPTNPQGKCLGIDPDTKKIGYINEGGGLVGMTGNLIAMTYNKPASSTDYVAYLSSNFGITKKAYAQGPGFEGLKPLLNIWRAFRNITFLFLILVTIVIGLGIMLRLQVDPRTVMTIQNQIPKIIIGLVLISLSYAIAGFLIDLMWVSIYLVFNIFAGIDQRIAQEITEPTLVTGKSLFTAIRQTPFEFASHLTSAVEYDRASWPNGLLAIPWIAAKSLGGVLGSLLNGMIDSTIIGDPVRYLLVTFTPMSTMFWGCVIPKILNPINIAGSLLRVSGDTFSTCANETMVAGLGGLADLIAFLIFFIALLWAMLRLWFALIKAYVFVILDVIFAPFWIMAGILPGGGGGFTPWIKDVIANLAAFPAVIVMFLLVKVLMSETISGVETVRPFQPPLIGNPGDPNLFAALAGFGILLMTPAVPKMMRDALKVQPMPYLAAVGAGIGAGQAVTGAVAGVTWHRLTRPRGQFEDPGRLRSWAWGRPEDNSRPRKVIRGIIGRQ